MHNPEAVAAIRAAPGARPVRVIAVTSGKGGVGKSTVSINLSLALAARGRRVLLLDADLGLANVDVMLGLKPQFNLTHVIDGQCTLAEAIVQGPHGVRVIPGASGIRRMAELSAPEQAGLVYAFSSLEGDTDVLIVDTPAGINAHTINFCAAAQEVIVVVCNEPASLTDAYATIKVLSQETARTRFHVLVNMARSPQDGQALFQKLTDATERFLDVSLDLIGTLHYDASVLRSIQNRRAVFDAYPSGGVATAFKKLAERADNWPVPRNASGHLEFFVERMVRVEPAPERRAQA